MMRNPYAGSDFDAFLQSEGILEEVTAKAHKRLLALQLQDAITSSNMTKTQIAEALQTSRSQLDRLLDPDFSTVSPTRAQPGCSVYHRALWRTT